MGDCFYSCMDGCGKGGGHPLQCEKECSGSCVGNPSIRSYGVVPTLEQAVRESGPALEYLKELHAARFGSTMPQQKHG